VTEIEENCVVVLSPYSSLSWCKTSKRN